MTDGARRRHRQHLPRRRRLRRRGRAAASPRRPMPDGVRVADFGIRGVHLAYELLDGYDALVLVDAVPDGRAAGHARRHRAGPIAAPSRRRRRRAGARRAQHEPGRRARHARRARRQGRPDPRRRLRARDARRGHRAVRPSRPPSTASIDAVDDVLAELCRPASSNPPQKGEPTHDPSLRSVGCSSRPIAGLVVKSLPDIARYLKIREM